MKTRRVLSIDWDWATGARCIGCNPALCGWPPVCAGGACYPRSTVRGQTIGHHNADDVRRRVATLLRLPISRAQSLYVAENHGDIFRVLDFGDCVYDFDAHCDDDSMSHVLNCANWRTYAKNVYAVRFANKFTPTRLPRNFDLVFICKSSPWTPKVYDEDLWGLVAAYATKTGQPEQFIGRNAQKLAREYQRALAKGV